MTEDPQTPEDVAAADKQARAALVRAEALAALAESGCEYLTLLLPSVEQELAAIHIGNGDDA